MYVPWRLAVTYDCLCHISSIGNSMWGDGSLYMFHGVLMSPMTARLVQLTTRMSNRQHRQLNMGQWVFTLCLRRPLERFRVLASGRVWGRTQLFQTPTETYGIYVPWWVDVTYDCSVGGSIGNSMWSDGSLYMFHGIWM